MNNKKRRVILNSLLPLLLMTVSVASPLQALAVAGDPDGSQSMQLSGAVTIADDEVDKVSKDILTDEIEILQCTTNFRNQYTKPDKWKKRRTTLYQIAASGMANGGDITLQTQFWHYNRNVANALKNRGRLEAGLIPVIAAYAAVIAAYSGELVFDQYSDMKVRHKHLDSKSTLQKVEQLDASIKKLKEQRALLLAKCPDQQCREFYTAEAKILDDCHNLILADFSRLYVDYKKRHAVRDLTSLGTIAVGATGLPATIQVLRGIQMTNIKKIGGGGISFIVSAGILTVAPELFEGGGRLAAAGARHQISEAFGQLQGATMAQMQTDAGDLVKLATRPGVKLGPSMSGRVEAYRLTEDILAGRQHKLDAEAIAARRKFVADVISYGIRGGCQIGWGTLIANGGYKYYNKPNVALKRVAQASTVNQVSWGSWMMEALFTGCSNEISNYKHGLEPDYDPFQTNGPKLEAMRNSLHKGL